MMVTQIDSVNKPRAGIQYTQTQVVPVNQHRLKANRVITGGKDPASTAYKILRTQVLQKLNAKKQNTLAIVSAVPDEGKTLTAINLSISLAKELRHTVLLADFDLGRPSVHRYFDYVPEVGLGDCLLHGAPLSSALFTPSIDGLVILPNRESISDSSELLTSPAMQNLVNDIKSRYDSRLIVFDLPPLLGTDDAVAFLPYVDAVLFVIREGRVKRDQLARAMDLVQGSRVIGTVLNASDDALTSYY